MRGLRKVSGIELLLGLTYYVSIKLNSTLLHFSGTFRIILSLP